MICDGTFGGGTGAARLRKPARLAQVKAEAIHSQHCNSIKLSR